ncbi:unnamed protein product [Vitrella brassicaformis CCMP3155]|uniref:Uncharacterized protein n=2 Tax=Vitrella brassicaformis TaxID=1169539 RepID=A0A0G4ECZ8_VITBC|nr:unnamed protein product [Vitrella brassicaformis CCMP3155]|eukprot:CEL93217.1 unnamed protein product [Vitrella brassicaformis CCMP3155]
MAAVCSAASTAGTLTAGRRVELTPQSPFFHQFCEALKAGALRQVNAGSDFVRNLGRRAAREGSQQRLRSMLKSVPAYTVVNELDEMIMSYPPSSHGAPVGLFFLNKRDANLFLEDVQTKDPETSREVGLSLRTSSLAHYYALSRQRARSAAHFYLVPDLQEVQKAVSQSPSGRFEGTPIYYLDLVPARDPDDRRQRCLYMLTLPKSKGGGGKDSGSNRPVFFTNRDALNTWRTFRRRHASLGLPRRPKVRVASLERMLRDLEERRASEVGDWLFVPAYEAYRDVQLNPPRSSGGMSGAKRWLQKFRRDLKAIVGQGPPIGNQVPFR